jgi:hypothetical protein
MFLTAIRIGRPMAALPSGAQIEAARLPRS